MKRMLLAMVALFVAAVPAPAPTAKESMPFNGKDLSGWILKGGGAKKSRWQVGTSMMDEKNPKFLAFSPLTAATKIPEMVNDIQPGAPSVDISNWPLFLFVLVMSALLASASGLFLGTVVNPRKISVLFAVVVIPVTFLGCVYYPWSALHAIRWLQILVLINPMVYMTEGLRAALTPSIGHMPLWAIMLALVGGTAVFGYLGVRSFRNRVVN